MSNRAARAQLEEPEEVLIPTTLAEALSMLRTYPEALVAAGGTHLMFDPPKRQDRRPILALHAIPDLRRVARSDSHVDIGSAVPLERLREVGQRFLPKPLIEALNQLGPAPVMNVATIGGAICLPHVILPVHLVLQLLDARVEIRRVAHGRWVSIAQLRENVGKPGHLNPGELVTRIRVPLRTWSAWSIATYGTLYPTSRDSLTVAALARVEKESLTEFCFAAVIRSRSIIRGRETEEDLAGRNVPVTARDRKLLVDRLDAHPLVRTELSALDRRRVIGGIDRFLCALKPE